MNSTWAAVARLAAAVWGLALAAAAPADMVVETWGAGHNATHPATIRIVRAEGAAPVIRVDLSALPAGAKIRRARLFVERKPTGPAGAAAPARNEVYALMPAPGGKGPGRAADKPLAVAAPAYDAFDAADAVGKRAGGSCAFLVKSLPGWIAESTRLEVAYEGKPTDVPAQVSGLKAFHRAGQTFLTWQEVQPLITGEKATWGEYRRKLAEAKDAHSYRVYAHDKPIDARTIADAALIADVGPLSAYNVNARNIEYLIAQAMAEPDEIGELARDYNGYMYTWGMDSKRMDRYPLRRFVVDPKAGPLGIGAGLYVHHPAAAGRRYYAVVSCRRGRENTADFSAANALTEPVAETVGLGRPVRQGPGLWGPFFDYPGRRQVYVQWCGPPLAPRANMYFNWSILVPPGLKEGRKVPLELYFHADGFSYANPRQKYIRHSVQIAPHDYPPSAWYGFNEAWGTLKSPMDAGVGNHTQRRIIAFLEWAKGQFPIDADRILLSGGDGAAMLALSYPQQFAYVMIGRFDSGVLEAKAAAKYAAIWGPKHAKISDARGRSRWGWALLDRLVADARGRDLPPFICRRRCHSWGKFSTQWGKGQGRFYKAMTDSRQPLFASWGWTPLPKPDSYTALWRGADITRTTPVPAFSNSSLDADSDSSGNVNQAYAWKDVVDARERCRITITGSHRDSTFDLALRRLAKFKVKPGERLRWQAVPAPTRRVRNPAPQGGAVTADAHGLFTLKGLKCYGGSALTVTVTRAE